MQKKMIYALVVVAVVVVASAAAVYVLTKSSEQKQKYPVYFVSMGGVSNMKGSLASGSIDGFIAWEPFDSDAIVDGVGTALEWSGSIMPGHPCCVVVASTDFISKDLGGGVTGSDITQRFVKAHAETTLWMSEALGHKSSANYSLLVNLGMQFTSKSREVVEASFVHLKYGYLMDDNYRDGITNFTDTFVNTGVVSSDKLALGGYSNIADFVNKYNNHSYLDALSSVHPSDTILNPNDAVRLGFLKADIHELAQFVAQNKTVGGGSKSMFEKYGVKVTNASSTGGYASGPEEMGKFAAGEVDIGYLGCAPAIQSRLNAQVHTVIVAQANIEGSAIVVKAGSDIHSIDDLQNKTIGVPNTGSIQFVLLKKAVVDAGLELQLKA